MRRPTAPEAKMLTTGEVGRALGVSINTVKSWARLGEIDAVRLPSGHLRIPRAELERLRRGTMPASRYAPGRWEGYEEWRRGRPVEDLDLDRVLAWIDAVLALARSQGSLPERGLEEKADGIRRMHRALTRVRR